MDQLAIAAAREADALIMSFEVDSGDYEPHAPTFRQKLFLDLNVKEAFYGGAAGGGKSDALLMAALQHIDKPGYAALLLRRTYADLILPEALMARAREWLTGTDAKWVDKEKTWLFPSGATLTFGYLESENDKYRYQGSAYQFIGFDELTQFTETQYLYLFSRLRKLEGADVPLRMRAASNPGGIGAEWVKSRFIPDDFLPVDAELPQIFWKNDLDAEDKPIQRAFVPARLADNPYLNAATYRESLNELDKVTREQLLHGDWTITAVGRLRFDVYAINRFQAKPGTDGELMLEQDERGRQIPVFYPRDNGLLRVFKPPQRGKQYVMGSDTAEGRDTNRGEGKADPDYSVTQVRDLDTGEQVARLRGRITERAFGDYNYALGVWYNLAYLVPEVAGGYGRAMLDRLLDNGYPISRIYTERDEEKTGLPERDELGWRTTGISRPKLVSYLDAAITEHWIETYDAFTIREYLCFEINKDGKAEARQGTHDDCVIADGLCAVGLLRAPREVYKNTGPVDRTQNPIALAKAKAAQQVANGLSAAEKARRAMGR